MQHKTHSDEQLEQLYPSLQAPEDLDAQGMEAHEPPPNAGMDEAARIITTMRVFGRGRRDLIARREDVSSSAQGHRSIVTSPARSDDPEACFVAGGAYRESLRGSTRGGVKLAGLVGRVHYRIMSEDRQVTTRRFGVRDPPWQNPVEDPVGKTQYLRFRET